MVFRFFCHLCSPLHSPVCIPLYFTLTSSLQLSSLYILHFLIFSNFYYFTYMYLKLSSILQIESLYISYSPPFFVLLYISHSPPISDLYHLYLSLLFILQIVSLYISHSPPLSNLYYFISHPPLHSPTYIALYLTLPSILLLVPVISHTPL